MKKYFYILIFFLSLLFYKVGYSQVELSFEVEQPDSPFMFDTTNSNNYIHELSSYGSSDGVVTVYVDGGWGSYTATWNGVTIPVNNGTTGNFVSITGINAGSYTLVVTDNENTTSIDGCVITQEFTFTNPPLLALSITESSPISCNSANMPDACSTCNQDGVLMGTATGGVPPYDFIWTDNNGITLQTTYDVALDPTTSVATDTLNNLAAGTYFVNIIDDNGITIVPNVTYTLSEPDPIVITNLTTAVTHANCFGDNNGSIHPNIQGGNPFGVGGGRPYYTIEWSTGQTTQNIDNLTAGNYTITITDSNGCQHTEDFIVKQRSKVQITIDSIDPITANGADNGGINVSVSGGRYRGVFENVTYSYQWQNAEGVVIGTTQDIDELGPGFYTLTVTTNNGCSETTEPIEITEPEVLRVSLTSHNILCNGDDNGQITAHPQGGIPINGLTYNYQWNQVIDGTSSSLPDENNQTITGLSPGFYNVEVTDSYNTIISDTIEITEPTEFFIDNFEKIDVSCFGDSTGYAYIYVDGGSPFQGNIYYFTLYDNNTIISEFFEVSEVEYENLPSGVYHIEVEDEAGCSLSQNFTITQPDYPLNYTLVSNTPTTGFGYTDGAIDITISGGTIPYTYKWTDSDGMEVTTTQDLVNFAAGDYHLVITDNKGCELEEDFTITQPTQIIINPNFVPISCYGGTTTLFINPTGGVLSNDSYYAVELYEIIDTDTVNLIGTYADTANGTGEISLGEKIAGNYRVEVTDSNGVTVSYDFEVTQNDEIAVTTNLNCYNGSITLDVTGGTNSYSYKIQQGSNPFSDWISFENASITIENLVVGDYTIQVKDTNDCIYTIDDITILQPLTISNPVVVNISENGLHNGSISIDVAGGTTPYTYIWTGPNGFTSDLNPISGLYAGDYNVTVTDSLGCTIANDENTPYIIGEPELLTVEIEQIQDIGCHGNNTATLEAISTGGVGSNTYTWYNTNDMNNPIYSSSSTRIYYQPAGNYTVVVTDSNGVTATNSFEVSEPDVITLATSNLTQVNCNGESTGAIDVSITGGTGAYTYLWSNGATTEDISNIAAGNYTLEVTDENLCTSELFEFEIIQLAVLSFSNDTLTHLTGFETNNGAIDITVSGGTAPYTYNWVSTNGFTSSDSAIAGLSAGTYTITITDAYGCELENTYTITQPDELEIELLYNEIDCNGNSTNVVANVSGGVLNTNETYQYQWYDNANNLIGTEDVISLTEGSYHIRVTDSNGNFLDDTLILTAPTQIEITSTTLNNVVCPETNTGSIQIEVVGGVGSYTFDWSNGETSQNIENLFAGNYSVIIYDENDCFISSDNFVISQPDNILIQTDQISPPSGFGLDDGFINISITGGTSPYTYQWTDDEGILISSSQDISDLEVGNYSLLAIDANNCSTTISYSLNEPEELTLVIQQNQGLTCNGDTSAILKAVSTGGVGGNTFTWYNTNDTNTPIYISSTTLITNLSAGSYYVVVTDANGITTTSSIFTVTQPDEIMVTTQTTNSLCYEDNDGSIALAVTGGSGSYLYRIKQGSSPYSDWISFTGSTITIANLPANNYAIQVQDTNGCYYEDNGAIATISMDITQPDLLAITSENVTNLTGFATNDGAIAITIIGGTTPYTYNWTGPNGFTSNIGSLADISAGNYTVTITDANGCEITENYTVTEPNTLIVVLEQQNEIACNGDETVSISTSITGGVAPYTYQWYVEGESDVIGDNSLLNNIGAGSYYVVVSDSNGIIVTSELINITQPDELTATFNATYVNCGTENDWQIEVGISGGIAPYNYAWSTGDDTNIITDQQIGTFMLIVSDANGCQITETYTIEEPEFLTVEAETTEISCFNTCDGAISLNISGGLAPYDILWDDENTESTRTNLCDGLYNVIVTDQKGCVFEHSFELINPDEIVIGLEDQVTTLCNDQYLELDVTIADEDAVYLWESANGFNSTSPTVELENEGLYTITITTSGGCEITDTIEIINSDLGLNAQFLVTSQAFEGEDVIIINTSNPITDDMEWIVPNDVQIIEQNSETITLRFNTEGAYDISLLTSVGDCEDYYSKTIIVNEARDLPDVGDADAPFISGFIIYPNPNNGNYDVSVTLSEPANISLRLFSLVSQTPLDDRIETGLSEYNLNYGLTNLSSGVYFLLLETPHGSQIKKVIIE